MSNLALSDVQRWLLESARPYLIDSAQKQRAGLSQIQQALLQQQIEWRRRSRFRFPNPDLWLWSDRSLSQASDWLSASFKASLFPENELLLDGCCGAGVDSVAAALRGPVIAVDEDPWMAALAASNAAVHGKLIQSFAEQLGPSSLRNAKWLHVDPDRRPGSVRTLEADHFSPSLEQVVQLAKNTEGAIVKIAPATRFSPEISEWVETNCARVWLGSFGECRQQVLLLGAARTTERLGNFSQGLDPTEPSSMAVVLGFPNSDGAIRFGCHQRFGDSRRDFVCEIFHHATTKVVHVGVADSADRYVYDLHPVLHASNLHEAWAVSQQLSALTDPRGFFTGKLAISNPLAQCFEFVEELSWDDRKLRKWLRSKSIGTVEIKCRLHALDASALQKRYSSEDGQPITLLVTRIGDRVRAIACRRVVSNTSEPVPGHDCL